MPGILPRRVAGGHIKYEGRRYLHSCPAWTAPLTKDCKLVTTISRVRLDGLLSFAPGSDAFELRPLNVLIGPNGAGKTNLIEAFELLAATPTDLAVPVRTGGGVAEWLWKGGGTGEAADGGLSAREKRLLEVRRMNEIATVEVVLDEGSPTGVPLQYCLRFGEVGNRLEVFTEEIADAEPVPKPRSPLTFLHLDRGPEAASDFAGERGRMLGLPQEPAPGTTNVYYRLDGLTSTGVSGHVERNQSVLAQFKEPDKYPEITWTGKRFASVKTFREWAIGRATALRRPQPADLPEDALLPDCSNLALVLNQIEHHGGREFNDLLSRFFPRFERLSTRIAGGAVQFYLHESGFSTPVPATRISDGTLRFIAVLATLLTPEPPPLACIEEPEIGLHPDAVALAAEVLVEASSRMQLVVTTHSDALVSALSSHVDSVVVCERPGAGTILKRLEADRLAKWLEEYRLGDLWRMGELGANP